MLAVHLYPQPNVWQDHLMVIGWLEERLQREHFYLFFFSFLFTGCGLLQCFSNFHISRSSLNSDSVQNGSIWFHLEHCQSYRLVWVDLETPKA